MVYCWRVGMLSAGVFTAVAHYLGERVRTLESGYKGYRRVVLQTLTGLKKIMLLCSQTVAGKTELIQALASAGAQAIDLEDLANIGVLLLAASDWAINPPSKTLKMGWLMPRSQHDRMPLCGWRRRAGGIGQTTIPQPVWEQMRLAHTVEIESSQTERLERILETYCKLPLDALKEGVVKIEKRFGIENCRRVLRHLDTGDVGSAARLLLTKYYDKSYTHPKTNQPAPKVRLDLSCLSPLKRVAKLMKVAETLA